MLFLNYRKCHSKFLFWLNVFQTRGLHDMIMGTELGTTMIRVCPQIFCHGKLFTLDHSSRVTCEFVT